MGLVQFWYERKEHANLTLKLAVDGSLRIGAWVFFLELHELVYEAPASKYCRGDQRSAREGSASDCTSAGCTLPDDGRYPSLLFRADAFWL